MPDAIQIQTVDGWLVLDAETYQKHLVKPTTPVVPPEPLVEADELAKQLNLPQSWIEQATREGRLPCHRFGKYVRFRVSEVAEASREERRPTRALRVREGGASG